MKEIMFEDLCKNDVFRSAWVKTYSMSMEELFIQFNSLDYESFGHGAIMLWKMNGSQNWRCALRNNKDWEDDKLDCQSGSPKDSLSMMYAWCKYKGYLK